MDELMDILENLHPDVDFENEDSLVDDGILDSFDLATLNAEIGSAYGVNINSDQLTNAHFNSAEDMYSLIQELEE